MMKHLMKKTKAKNMTELTKKVAYKKSEWREKNAAISSSPSPSASLLLDGDAAGGERNNEIINTNTETEIKPTLLAEEKDQIKSSDKPVTSDTLAPILKITTMEMASTSSDQKNGNNAPKMKKREAHGSKGRHATIMEGQGQGNNEAYYYYPNPSSESSETVHHPRSFVKQAKSYQSSKLKMAVNSNFSNNNNNVLLYGAEVKVDQLQCEGIGGEKKEAFLGLGQTRKPGKSQFEFMDNGNSNLPPNFQKLSQIQSRIKNTDNDSDNVLLWKEGAQNYDADILDLDLRNVNRNRAANSNQANNHTHKRKRITHKLKTKKNKFRPKNALKSQNYNYNHRIKSPAPAANKVQQSEKLPSDSEAVNANDKVYEYFNDFTAKELKTLGKQLYGTYGKRGEDLLIEFNDSNNSENLNVRSHVTFDLDRDYVPSSPYKDLNQPLQRKTTDEVLSSIRTKLLGRVRTQRLRQSQTKKELFETELARISLEMQIPYRDKNGNGITPAFEVSQSDDYREVLTLVEAEKRHQFEIQEQNLENLGNLKLKTKFQNETNNYCVKSANLDQQGLTAVAVNGTGTDTLTAEESVFGGGSACAEPKPDDVPKIGFISHSKTKLQDKKCEIVNLNKLPVEVQTQASFESLSTESISLTEVTSNSSDTNDNCDENPIQEIREAPEVKKVPEISKIVMQFQLEPNPPLLVQNQLHKENPSPDLDANDNLTPILKSSLDALFSPPPQSQPTESLGTEETSNLKAGSPSPSRHTNIDLDLEHDLQPDLSLSAATRFSPPQSQYTESLGTEETCNLKVASPSPSALTDFDLEFSHDLDYDLDPDPDLPSVRLQGSGAEAEAGFDLCDLNGTEDQEEAKLTDASASSMTAESVKLENIRIRPASIYKMLQLQAQILSEPDKYNDPKRFDAFDLVELDYDGMEAYLKFLVFNSLRRDQMERRAKRDGTGDNYNPDNLSPSKAPGTDISTDDDQTSWWGRRSHKSTRHSFCSRLKKFFNLKLNHVSFCRKQRSRRRGQVSPLDDDEDLDSDSNDDDDDDTSNTSSTSTHGTRERRKQLQCEIEGRQVSDSESDSDSSTEAEEKATLKTEDTPPVCDGKDDDLAFDPQLDLDDPNNSKSKIQIKEVEENDNDNSNIH